MRYLLGFSGLICWAAAQYVPPPPSVTPILDKIRCASFFAIDTTNCVYKRCDDKENGTTTVSWIGRPTLGSRSICGVLQAVQNQNDMSPMAFSVTADNWLYRIQLNPDDLSKVAYIQYATEELCAPQFIVGSYDKARQAATFGEACISAHANASNEYYFECPPIIDSKSTNTSLMTCGFDTKQPTAQTLIPAAPSPAAAGGSSGGVIAGVLITFLILGAIGGFVFRKYQTKRYRSPQPHAMRDGDTW
jgi:hypothetical protein